MYEMLLVKAASDKERLGEIITKAFSGEVQRERTDRSLMIKRFQEELMAKLSYSYVEHHLEKRRKARKASGRVLAALDKGKAGLGAALSAKLGSKSGLGLVEAEAVSVSGGEDGPSATGTLSGGESDGQASPRSELLSRRGSRGAALSVKNSLATLHLATEVARLDP
jgi:hypothetical protein